MDGTTEPIIAVIGHPIAGNPSQFAVERALDAMNLEWRVLSFDVEPKDVAAALEGFSVTGIVGVLIDPTVGEAASEWYAAKASDGARTDGALSGERSSDDTSDDVAAIDCLFRDDEEQFVGGHEHQAWVDDQVIQHAGEIRAWIGDKLDGLPINAKLLLDDSAAIPPRLAQIEEANLIVIADGQDGPVELEAEDWPADDGSTLVIDLSDGRPDHDAIRKLGYRLLTIDDRRTGTLHRCLERWTGQSPPKDVIHDAIEEYLGV